MRLLFVLLLLLFARGAGATELFGADYQPCGDRQSTLEMVDCTKAKTKVWDQRLNKAYTALLNKAEPGQREPLRAAQRLWVQYRDANCLYYGSGDGTIHQVEAAECVRAMTEDRARELEQAGKQ